MNRPVSSDVPQDCPGTEAPDAGRRDTCAGCPNQAICASKPKGPDPELEVIARRLEKVKHTVLVLSGKGGVGKSTVAAQLALALARDGEKDVGLLDIDICGPSIPKMMGLEGEDVHQSGAGWSPVYCAENLGVMSIGFMLPNPDDAVVWRGPRKNALIKQFLKDVDWGELDYLVIDAPPGTSDEHISVAQYLKATKVDGVLMVTTPQDVALADVRKELNFCKKVGLSVLGIIENMSTLRQPMCQFRFFDRERDVTAEVMAAVQSVFPETEHLTAAMEVLDATSGGGRRLAEAYDVPFLGSIPLDPCLSQASESGQSILDMEKGTSAPSASAFKAIFQKVMKTMM